MMKKYRLPKLLHGTIGTFLSHHFPLSKIGFLITVTELELSPDGLMAKIFISLMSLDEEQANREQEIGKVMESIEEEKYALKRYIVTHLGKTLRRIPELYFYRDDRALKASRVAKLLRQER